MSEALREKIEEWNDEAEVIREGLWYCGPKLISNFLWSNPNISLRQMAKNVGYSPAYLSRIQNGHEIISTDAYLRISNYIDKAAQPQKGQDNETRE